MTPARILVVEDDRVVARDIQHQLTRIGHTIAGVTPSGEDAVRLALESRPDLVLMDIRLEGALDGVDAAHQIRDRCQVPVVFLTAYADEETLQRARVTEPFGYLLKPFEDSQLRTVIEMALYKHTAERKLRESERRYAVTLASIGDAVIATDDQARVTFLNPVAEALTGWPREEAIGRPLAEVFHIINEETRQPVEDPAAKVLRLGTVVGLANRTVLLARDGREVPIDDCGAHHHRRPGEHHRRGPGLPRHDPEAAGGGGGGAAQDPRASGARGAQARTWASGNSTSRTAASTTAARSLLTSGRCSVTIPSRRRPTSPPGLPSRFIRRIRNAWPAVQAWVNGESPEFEAEYRVRRKDGSDRWRLAHGVVVPDAGERRVRLLGSSVDITRSSGPRRRCGPASSGSGRSWTMPPMRSSCRTTGGHRGRESPGVPEPGIHAGRVDRDDPARVRPRLHPRHDGGDSGGAATPGRRSRSNPATGGRTGRCSRSRSGADGSGRVAAGSS